MLDDEFAPSPSSNSAIPSAYFFVTTLSQNLTGTINFITTLVGSVGSAEYHASVDEGFGLSVSAGGPLVWSLLGAMTSTVASHGDHRPFSHHPVRPTSDLALMTK
jgi:hypothetical protein